MKHRRLNLYIPDPVESRRSASGRAVRFIYGTGIIILGLFLLWHFGKPLIFLEGPGKVTARSIFISAPYIVTVTRMSAGPGSRVVKGDEIGRLKSLQVEQYITDLLKLTVEQNNKEAEYKIRLAFAKATRKYSQKRLDVAKEFVARLEGGPRAATSVQYKADVYRERASANLVVAQSEVEADDVRNQLNKLIENGKLIAKQLENIRRDYNDGRIITPASGVMSSRVAKDGETLVTGSAIAEIFDSDDIHIEWRIPSWRWIEPQSGDQVFIRSGVQTILGHIETIAPLSIDFASPARSVMQGVEHGQIARVTGPGLEKLPLNSYVSVGMNYSNASNLISKLYCRVFRCIR